jgi:Phosphopantetheine attachment site
VPHLVICHTDLPAAAPLARTAFYTHFRLTSIVVRRHAQAFGVALPVTVVFDHPTVAALAALLAHSADRQNLEAQQGAARLPESMAMVRRQRNASAVAAAVIAVACRYPWGAQIRPVPLCKYTVLQRNCRSLQLLLMAIK